MKLKQSFAVTLLIAAARLYSCLMLRSVLAARSCVMRRRILSFRAGRSFGLPSSAIVPSDSTTILSAPLTVRIRRAMTITVLFRTSGGVFFGKSSKSDQAMPLTAMMEEYGLKYAGSIDGKVLCL